MNTRAADSHDGLLQQLSTDASLVDVSAGPGTHGTGGPMYQEWLPSLSEQTRQTTTFADAWQAGATAMFQRWSSAATSPRRKWNGRWPLQPTS
jgi:hypothetical protein